MAKHAHEREDGDRNDPAGAPRDQDNGDRTEHPAAAPQIGAGGGNGSNGGPTAEAVAQEALRSRRLQRAIDVSLALIYQSQDLTLGQSLEIVIAARSIALDLFPGSGDTFDMLYRPRLMRAIGERFGIPDAPDRIETP